MASSTADTQPQKTEPTILLDDSLWPIAVIKVRGTPTMKGAQELARITDELFDRRRKFAVLIDPSLMSNLPNADVRSYLAAYQTRNQDRFVHWVVADGVVVPSTLLRGLMTAIYWMSPPKHPARLFATLAAAVTWARAQLQIS